MSARTSSSSLVNSKVLVSGCFVIDTMTEGCLFIEAVPRIIFGPMATSAMCFKRIGFESTDVTTEFFRSSNVCILPNPRITYSIPDWTIKPLAEFSLACSTAASIW